MTVHLDDGTEETIGAGDELAIEPEHHAWTVGDKPCILFEPEPGPTQDLHPDP